jgi:uncharacterized protein (TIGR00159 family)
MEQWLADLSRLDWWPWLTGALDVLLVFFLIYRLLLLVRGTRAERMLLGLGIVVLVFVFSRALNLATLNWILGNFLGSVILVIVVLFQDDFRRVLTKVGLIPGFGSEAPQALLESIEEISIAASELSSRRLGAIIAISGDVGLDEYTEHAISIEGKVSHQLLVAIFLPTSPLHDGAVVVKKDSIVAAGAVLPLTFNANVSSAYGTRHRAAIGLSERTDAVIVVVSEETGTISLVRDGKMTRDLKDTALATALRRLLIVRHTRRAKKILEEKEAATAQLEQPERTSVREDDETLDTVVVDAVDT